MDCAVQICLTVSLSSRSNLFISDTEHKANDRASKCSHNTLCSKDYLRTSGPPSYRDSLISANRSLRPPDERQKPKLGQSNIVFTERNKFTTRQDPRAYQGLSRWGRGGFRVIDHKIHAGAYIRIYLYLPTYLPKYLVARNNSVIIYKNKFS